MKIGDEVYVHGIVDEIRKDCVIIKNVGGYFGTAISEILERPIDGLTPDYYASKYVCADGQPCSGCAVFCEHRREKG